MITITLEFSKNETKLAGFPYGRAVYIAQARDNIKFNDEITIIFPEQIEQVASSFVQGFFAEIVSIIGYKGVGKNITIISKSDKLTDSIYKNIY